MTPEPDDSLRAIFGEPIYTFTRRQAIEDGQLVDVTPWADGRSILGGGFKVPVAFTRALWSAVNAIPERLRGVADVRGRAHDVLWMALVACRRARHNANVTFKVILPRDAERGNTVELLANCGPDDDGKPCVTIGFGCDF